MHKRLWIIILFVIALLGAGVPAYFYNVRPITVVGPAIMKLQNATALSAALTVATFAPESMIKNAAGDSTQLNIPISVVGQVEMNMPVGAAPSGTGTLAVVGYGKDAKDLTLDIVSGADGTSFARATNIPTDPQGRSALAGSEGVWYSMATRTLAAYFLRDTDTVAPTAPSGPRPAATWGALLNDLSSGDMFGIPVVIDNKVVAGVTVGHYQMPLRHDALVGFMQDFHSAARGRALTDDELKAVSAAVDSNDTSLELWIDTKRDEVVQLQIDVKPHNSKDAQFSMLVKFTSWNVPVPVTPPTDSKPFSDLVQRLAHPVN